MNHKPAAPSFDSAFRAGLFDLFAWRRDVRRFRSESLPKACWRNSSISLVWRHQLASASRGIGDRRRCCRREAVIENFKSCNADALGAYTGDLSTRYAALKLAGLREAPCHLAVFADRSTVVGHGLGRRTMPEMADYSVVTAMFSIWLAARAEGVGMGWVSILDSVVIGKVLDVPRTGG